MKYSNFFKVLSLVIASSAFVACGGSQQTEAQQESTVVEKPKVSIKQVFEREVDQLGKFTATVEANVTNNISPKMATRIEKVLVEIGDRVKKGEIVAKMDAVNLTQAKLQMQNSEIEFNRTDELYKIGGTSKSEWDARKLAYSIAKNSYEDLLENTALVSPISGVITARNYDSGDMYTGMPLYIVEEITPVKLKVNVSEKLYTKVKKGMSVDVNLDVYGDEKFEGKISLIYPTLDPTTRTFPVEITIPNSNQKVRPGMFARVTFIYGTENRVVVPDIAIIKQQGSGNRYIYVVNNGVAEMKMVELGQRFGTEYEVISGINSEDTIVIGGQSRLTNGAEVEVVK